MLRATKDAIDFPGFVTSLITGVFQAMTTSTIQQLQAVADLLDAVNAGASEFGTKHVTGDRAVEWAVNRFPALTRRSKGDKEPRLVVRPNGEMPDSGAAQSRARGDRLPRSAASKRTTSRKRCCRSSAASSRATASRCCGRWC